MYGFVKLGGFDSVEAYQGKQWALEVAAHTNWINYWH